MYVLGPTFFPEEGGDVAQDIAALARVLPASVMDAVLADTKKKGQRDRKLPRKLVAWVVVGMALLRDLKIEDVLETVAKALDLKLWSPGATPVGTSITQARDRLGWEVLRTLYNRAVAAFRSKAHSADVWKGHEVYGLDGTSFVAPDTPENEAWFGRPAVARGGSSAFPQIHAVFLVGIWSHVIVDAVFGPFLLSEMRVAEYLLDRLKTGSILLVDRAYFGFMWPVQFMRRGVHFVIRMKQGKNVLKPTRIRSLGRGDSLCDLPRPKHLRKGFEAPEERIRVRVITCKRRGFRPVLVMTDLLDHEKYPPEEISALYRDRWEGELAYRELKVQLPQTRVTFRSKKPARVLQEAYGLLIAYNCVRALMCEAAERAGVRPIGLSFADSVVRLRWLLTDRACDTADRLVADLARCLLPPRRRGRSCPRVVKVKILTNFPRKRSDRPPGLTSRANTARKRELRRAAVA